MNLFDLCLNASFDLIADEKLDKPLHFLLNHVDLLQDFYSFVKEGLQILKFRSKADRNIRSEEH